MLWLYAGSANLQTPHGRGVFVVKPIPLHTTRQIGGAIVWDAAGPPRQAPTVKFPCLITLRQKFRPCSFIGCVFFCERFIIERRARVGASSGIAHEQRTRMRSWQWPWPSPVLRPTSARRCVSLGCCYQSHGCARAIERDDTCSTKAVLITYIYLKVPWIHLKSLKRTHPIGLIANLIWNWRSRGSVFWDKTVSASMSNTSAIWNLWNYFGTVF